MFCPSCRSEFRPGFTRCAGCDVDLVDALPGPSRRSATAAPAKAKEPGAAMANYCGFFSLEEAYGAREALRNAGIAAEILIRESPAGGDPPPDEFWIRLDPRRAQAAVEVLGFDGASEEAGGATFTCGGCGREVAEEEHFCPHCGAAFEDEE